MEKEKSKEIKILASQRYIFIPPPPTGYVEELMAICAASKNTIRYALRGETYSRKAEEIRQAYYNRYIKPYLENNQNI